MFGFGQAAAEEASLQRASLPHPRALFNTTANEYRAKLQLYRDGLGPRPVYPSAQVEAVERKVDSELRRRLIQELLCVGSYRLQHDDKHVQNDAPAIEVGYTLNHIRQPRL